nr:hypothetical protein [uncultured Draconibacterium sp.]
MDVKDLLNWGELSRQLAGSRQTIRKNKIPLKHQPIINELTAAMEKVLYQMPPQAAQKGKKENGK